MSIADVKDLPLNEKFQILEMIWEEMSEKVDNIGVSREDQLHLDHRLERLSSEAAKVLNWDEVKDTLGN